MTAPVDVLGVLDVQRELGVKQSAKNANAGFVDWRDWCAFIGRAEEARAAVAELIEACWQIKDVRSRPSTALVRSEAWRKFNSALARVGGAK